MRNAQGGERGSLDERRLADALADLGLEDLEAEIYLVLLRNGPSQAGSIHSLCDASRGKVYDVLSELVAKGLAEKSAGTPAVYEAEDPEHVFEVSRRRLDRHRAYIDVLQDRTLADLHRIQRTEDGAIDHTWEILEGRGQIYERLSQAIEDAEESLLAVTNHDVVAEPIPAVEQTWQAIVRQADEGLSVRLLVGEDAPSDELLGRFDVDELEVRCFEHPETIHFVVVDGEDVFLWLVPSQRQGVHKHDDVTVRTNTPGLRTLVEEMADRLWAEARDPRQGSTAAE